MQLMFISVVKMLLYVNNNAINVHFSRDDLSNALKIVKNDRAAVFDYLRALITLLPDKYSH